MAEVLLVKMKMAFFSSILVFMIVGRHKSIPYVIKEILKIRMSGELMKREIEESLRTMMEAALISDNQSSNVLGFSQQINLCGNGNAADNYFIYFRVERYIQCTTVYIL